MARGSPTLETLALFAVVFAVQWVVGLLAGTFVFALAPPLSVRPWTLVTSVYAHAGTGHLLANALALLFVGFAVERTTTRLRFHAFFLATGMVSGVAQVLVTGAVGRPSAVVGASGAIFALFGYLLTGNRVAGALLGLLDSRPWLKLAVLVALAAVVTLATGAPGVALVAHFTGLVVGLVAGRAGLLSAERSRNASY